MASSHEYRGALAEGPVRGRGAGLNPGNRFETTRIHILGEHLDGPDAAASELDVARESVSGRVPTRVLPDESRTVINRVDPKMSPDIGFRWTINPYRGCEHGCIYCYARPGHEYLGLSCGLDFETRIFAKLDAPRLLRRELAGPGWAGESIILSGVTDPYQPVEAKLEITRRCLAVMAQCGQPVSVITKNRLVVRDVDHLKMLAGRDGAHVAISLTTLDAGLAAKLEPRASSPVDRLRTIRELSRAGVPVRS